MDTRPIHKKLLGDTAIAARWIPFATNKVLHILSLGLTPFSKNYVTDEVKIRIWDDPANIYVTIEGLGCPNVESGFADIDYNLNGEYEPQLLDKLSNFFEMDKDGIPDTNLVAETLDGSVERRENILWRAGALYSGLMRKVVQLYQGTTKKEIPFENTFLKTHGIFVSNVNRSRWVIEVGYDGIYRIPITFCKPLPEDWKELTLQGKENPDWWKVIAFSIDNKKIIGGSPYLLFNARGDSYSYGPFYNWCGWAFDYTGHNISNIAVESPIDPVETVDYNWSILIDLEVIEDNELGMPISINTTVSERAILFNPYRDDNEESADTRIYSAWISPGIVGTYSFWGGFSLGDPGEAVAPVFVFYDGLENNKKMVVRWHYKRGGSRIVEDLKLTEGYAKYPARHKIAAGDFVLYSAEGNFGYLPEVIGLEDIDATVAIPGLLSFSAPGIGLGEVEEYITSGTREWLEVTGSMSNLTPNVGGLGGLGMFDSQMNVGGSFAFVFHLGDGNIGYDLRETSSGIQHTIKDCIVLHGQDRESFIHVRWTRNDTTNVTLDVVRRFKILNKGFRFFNNYGSGDFAPLAAGNTKTGIYAKEYSTYLGRYVYDYKEYEIQHCHELISESGLSFENIYIATNITITGGPVEATPEISRYGISYTQDQPDWDAYPYKIPIPVMEEYFRTIFFVNAKYHDGGYAHWGFNFYFRDMIYAGIAGSAFYTGFGVKMDRYFYSKGYDSLHPTLVGITGYSPYQNVQAFIGDF
jgi:hypothetical protein